MSALSTPKRTLQGSPKRTRKTPTSSTKKPTRTLAKASLDKRKVTPEIRKGPEEKPKKKTVQWNKTEEVLTHVALVGLGDCIPGQIQKSVRQKVMASRRALQRRADPLEVTKPLQDLAGVIEEHGLKASTLMNDQLFEIRTVMEQSAMEKFDDRTARAKDTKGLEMKRKLEQAKSVLGQLAELNELKILVRNSVDSILKVNGYLADEEDKVQAISPRGSPAAENRGVKEPTLEMSNRGQSRKKMEGVLDHLMRVCQRPNITTELQQLMQAKIAASRKLLEMKVDPLKVSKPLYKLIDLLNDHCLESSDLVKIHLDEMQNLSESKTEREETPKKSRESNGVEVRKTLGQARSCLNYLSEMNHLKMIIKKSADMIRRGGLYKGEELQSLLTAIDEEDIFNVGAMIRDAEKANLPPTVKSMVKIALSRVAEALGAPRGRECLGKHLLRLAEALGTKNSEQVSVACSALIVAITECNRTAHRRKKLPRKLPQRVYQRLDNTS